MIDLASQEITEHAEKGSVLAAISHVTHLCQAPPPEAVLDYVTHELDALKSLVQRQWPLPSQVKSQIDLGPFAAKNIADWNPALADALMVLDYSLQHDGASIDKLLPYAVVSGEQKVAY